MSVELVVVTRATTKEETPPIMWVESGVQTIQIFDMGIMWNFLLKYKEGAQPWCGIMGGNWLGEHFEPTILKWTKILRQGERLLSSYTKWVL